MNDNRRNVRVETNAEVSFKVKFTHLTGSSRILNISEGGLCIQSKDYLPVKSVLELDIRCKKLNKPIELMARVVRIIYRDKGKFQFEVGLEFLDVDYNHWKRLYNYIQEHKAQSGC